MSARFPKAEACRAHLGGMPEYVSENKIFHTVKVWLTKQEPPKGKNRAFVTVHFRKERCADHLADFAHKLNKKIFWDTRERTLDNDEQGLAALLFNGAHKIRHHSCWFPWKPDEQHSRYAYRQENGEVVNPKYPVYIISLGRWKTPQTARALERMSVPYRIVVEPQEYENYAAVINSANILTLPAEISGTGTSVPSRNWVWEHSIDEGHKRHWVLDDNIPQFYRMHHNRCIRVETGAIFRAVETFADRYENIAFTGCYSHQFIVAKQKYPYFFLNNTRVYSCTLIKNDLDLSGGRWLGKYNEDTEIQIRALKAGWCVVSFAAFTIHKIGTMRTKGGNTKTLYVGDPTKEGSGRHKMAQSIVLQHPDVATLAWRHGRLHHDVDYEKASRIGGSPVLKLREGVVIPEGANNFGMACFERKTGKKVTLGEDL